MQCCGWGMDGCLVRVRVGSECCVCVCVGCKRGREKDRSASLHPSRPHSSAIIRPLLNIHIKRQCHFFFSEHMSRMGIFTHPIESRLSIQFSTFFFFFLSPFLNLPVEFLPRNRWSCVNSNKKKTKDNQNCEVDGGIITKVEAMMFDDVVVGEEGTTKK